MLEMFDTYFYFSMKTKGIFITSWYIDKVN